MKQGSHPISPFPFPQLVGRLMSNSFLQHRYHNAIQEAQLSPRDRAMRGVNRNLANCHATVQILLIRQVLTKSMV